MDLARHHAAATPDKAAIIDGDTVTTYAELNTTVNRAARPGSSPSASQPGRARGVVRAEQPPVLTFIHAARKVGLVAVPAAYRFTAEEMQYVIDNSDAVLVVVDAEQADKVAASATSCPKVREVVVFDGAPFDGARAWDDVRRRGRGRRADGLGRQRRRHDDLHVGHHREAEGRAAHAHRPGAGRSRCSQRAAAAARRRGAHHHRAAVPLGSAGVGVAHPHARRHDRADAPVRRRALGRPRRASTGSPTRSPRRRS